MSPLRIALFLGASLLLLLLGVVAYAARVSSSAGALIRVANEIHSTADAEREIAALRNRSGWSLWHEQSTAQGEQVYNIHVENGLLHRVRLVPPAMVGMTLLLHDGKLRSIILTMFSGRYPSTTSGVWVQEWFAPDTASSFHVNDNGRPWKATIDFSSTLPQAQRDKALSLNSKCLVRPGGCQSAEDILPGVWQLGEPTSGRVNP